MTDSDTTPSASLADGSRRRLDPRYVSAQRIVAAITSAVLLVGALFGTGVITLARGSAAAEGLLLFGLAILLPLFLAGLMIYWPGLAYRYISYTLSDQGIRIERGVVWRTVNSVPRNRVQHTDVSQGPIDRAYGLGTLVIYTAGTQHAAVTLEGLAHETAIAIRDHLIVGGEDDAV